MMPINIKNYTTDVSAEKSIQLIENLLMNFGASHIMKEYENGQPKSISFRISVHNMPLAFQLPAKPKQIYGWLKKKKPNSQPKTLLEQSNKIAWKQQYELLFLQLSMVEMEQLEIIEALLPYAFDVSVNKTFYEKLKETKFSNLLPSSS